MKKTIKTLVFILPAILFSELARAQNTKIDSLDQLIKKAVTDTARINLISQKLDVLSTINLDSAINLALKTLKETQKIQFYRGELEILEKLIYNYSYKGNYKAASEQLKNLEKLTKPGKDSTGFANLYSSKGLLYGMQSKYDTSIYYYEKAIRIFERTGERKRLSVCYSNIAIGYQQQSNFSGALFYQQKSLKLYEQDKNDIGQAYTSVNMANTYLNMGDMARSESTFLKSIELAKKNQLIPVELYSYTNLSSLYMDQAKWQKSYEYSIKAVELGEKMGDQGIQAASLSKASRAMVYLNQPEKALALAEKAIALADSSAQPLNISQAYSGMGLVLKSQKKWEEAIPFYEKGFESLKDADLYTLDNGRLYKELSECYERTGNYSKSLEMFKQSAMISDSVKSSENIKKATELMMNYEFEKKEQTAKARQDAKDEITHARQVALIIGLVLSLLLIIGSFIAYYNKQKANALLLNQKKDLENTLTQLRNTQAQLIQSEKMASLGELTAGIAHEIQNPLNFVNNFSEVSNELIDEMNEELDKGDIEEAKAIASDIKQNLGKINHHGKRADAIVKGMLQHSRSSNGTKEPTDINALADEYLRLAYHGLRAKDKDFNAAIETDFDESIGTINVIPQDIGRVILNLITNAFYAVNTKEKQGINGYEPIVAVNTMKENNQVLISVKDNGNGISQKILDKIFQPFFTTKPTGQGTGLGLSLSYDIVKAHGGELKFETKEGEGSTFIIKLPV
jgi:signal transduction histidine kinase